MKHTSFSPVNRRHWIQSSLLLCGWILVLGILGCGQEGEPEAIRFDVQEGLAIDTLKEAARQAKVEFIFSSELVRGIITPAINGKYTPSDAFKMMLASSSFVVVQHQDSGVYSIQKISDQ